jgi:hypothetical protein
MKEFMMLFRSEERSEKEFAALTPEAMQAQIQLWQDWIGGIAAQGKFIASDALANEGKIVRANNVITDGPYIELKEMVGGYILVKADDMDDAIKLSEGCPTLDIGGNVEVRPLMKF